jgi:hypothetical protein
MKIELGKTYKSRAGAKVRIICVDKKSGRPVVGLITLAHDDEDIYYFNANGNMSADIKECEHDLVCEWPEERHGYMWMSDDKVPSEFYYSVDIAKQRIFLEEGYRLYKITATPV